MTARILRLTGLTVALFALFSAKPAQADEIPGTLPATPVHYTVISEATSAKIDYVQAKAIADADRQHPVCDWIKSRPLYCWASHNKMGCGSLKSECTFLFGSCREFFGEPCYKGPPPNPLLELGYDPGPAPARGCRRCAQP
jgi:hypothetical protein